jgi:DNA-binding NarL/FixJ family response regulator
MGALLPATASAPRRGIARRTQRGRAPTLPVTEEIDVLYITPEERATLQLLADGKKASEIAVRLRVPECRIDEQLTSLFERLGATSRTEAVAAAARRGLVAVHPALSVGIF